MWRCEAREKDININSKSSDVKSTAHLKKFHRFEKKSEYKVKFVRREDGEEKAFFTMTKSCRSLSELFEKQSQLDRRIQEYEQEESGFSFDSIIGLAMKIFRNHAIGVSIHCILTEPNCKSKFVLNSQITDDK